jgi:hypothetical protein
MLDRKERDKMVKKLRSPFSVFGVRLPSSITLEGEEIPVEKLVLKLGKKDLSNEDVLFIREIIKKLKNAIERRIQAMEREEISDEEFKNLYEETLILKRALLEFESLLSKTSLKDTSLKIEDYKRWLEYMKQILG